MLLFNMAVGYFLVVIHFCVMHFLLISLLLSIYTVRSRNPNHTNTHTCMHIGINTGTQTCWISPVPPLLPQIPPLSSSSCHNTPQRGASRPHPSSTWQCHEQPASLEQQCHSLWTALIRSESSCPGVKLPAVQGQPPLSVWPLKLVPLLIFAL